MTKIPVDIKKLLNALKEGLVNILDKDLFGIYVYGSLTYNAFNPETSDVDVVVVLKKELNKKQILKLNNLHKIVSVLGKRGNELEIDYINKNKFFKQGIIYELWGNKFKKVKYKDTFKTIVWFNIKKSGITLFGANPSKWIPKISRAQIYKALQIELKTNRKYINKGSKLLLWEQVYSTLALCRILFTQKKYSLVSKDKAGKWALKSLDKEWQGVIKLALKYRLVRTKRASMSIFKKNLPKFSDYVEESLKKETGN